VRHPSARRHLAALHDGTLAEDTAAKVKAHAGGCARCRRLLAEYQAMDRLLRAMPEALVPPAASAAADTFLGFLAGRVGPARAPWFERLPIHPLGALATAAALLLAVFLLTPPFVIETAEPFNVAVLTRAHPSRIERPRRGSPTTQPVLREHASESYLLPVAVR
jgi:anti-sigma factor RsiW